MKLRPQKYWNEKNTFNLRFHPANMKVVDQVYNRNEQHKLNGYGNDFAHGGLGRKRGEYMSKYIIRNQPKKQGAVYV